MVRSMRFGLFSAAAPLAISDDSMFPDKKGKFQNLKLLFAWSDFGHPLLNS